MKENDSEKLLGFYSSIPEDGQVLVLVGGGTAALTYLYTQDQDDRYSHIVILGDRGYWGTASHRLAQPHHILALPHRSSDAFVDPAEHDRVHGILPHLPTSAYVHSEDLQKRIVELEKATVEVLEKKGKKVFIASQARVERIQRLGEFSFTLKLQDVEFLLMANKLVIASGAGPSRSLPPQLYTPFLLSATDNNVGTAPEAAERIMNYTDILTDISEKCRGKKVLIYGGGATAAWAMEVAALKAEPVAWVSRSGFDLVVGAGPRVVDIRVRSRDYQLLGSVTALRYERDPIDKTPKVRVTVTLDTEKGHELKEFMVDYFINCIGQEPYEAMGIPHVLSDELRSEIVPYLDKNNVSGTVTNTRLAWATGPGDLMIIGAAQGTYYNKGMPTAEARSVSEQLPRSAQVSITVGAVVASVCALTNYMPFAQDPDTGDVTLLSLNINIMNATQLAVYFTATYPLANAEQVNIAVKKYISLRSQTEFGLTDEETFQFMQTHFAHIETDVELPEDYEEGMVSDDEDERDSYEIMSEFLEPSPRFIDEKKKHKTGDIAADVSPKKGENSSSTSGSPNDLTDESDDSSTFSPERSFLRKR